MQRSRSQEQFTHQQCTFVRTIHAPNGAIHFFISVRAYRYKKFPFRSCAHSFLCYRKAELWYPLPAPRIRCPFPRGYVKPALRTAVPSARFRARAAAPTPKMPPRSLQYSALLARRKNAFSLSSTSPSIYAPSRHKIPKTHRRAFYFARTARTIKL